MNKEIPQASEQSTSPIDGDLSRDLNRQTGQNVKRKTGITGLAAAALIAGSGAVSAVRAQESSPNPSPEPTPIVSFMEIADTNGDDELSLGEVLRGFPIYVQAVAERAQELAEAQAEQEEFISTEKLLNEIVNQKDEDIKKIKVDQLKNKTNKLFEMHEEEISSIDLFGDGPLTQKDLKDYYIELVNGAAYNKNAPEEQKKLDRFVMAGSLMIMFLEIYDKTQNPDIKRQAAEIADMNFDHAMTVIYDGASKVLRRNLKENAETVLGLNR